ncbi:MAG: NADH-quinone oxidoreductase subunit C [Bacteroidetes bacterium]|nr:NADH-quinone oxidoreductase subunit C [Bacteroidota bacterium]
MPSFDETLSRLQTELAGRILKTDLHRGETTLFLDKKDLVSVCQTLKSGYGFNFLADVLGTDRFTDDDRYEVVYHLRNFSESGFLRLVVRVDEADLTVDSVCGVWKTANWEEREVFDMYGIRFNNHPDLRRMYMPQDFAYHPLRKEFPLIGIEGSIPLPAKE